MRADNQLPALSQGCYLIIGPFTDSIIYTLRFALGVNDNCLAENQTPRAVNKNIALKMNTIVILLSIEFDKLEVYGKTLRSHSVS